MGHLYHGYVSHYQRVRISSAISGLTSKYQQPLWIDATGIYRHDSFEMEKMDKRHMNVAVKVFNLGGLFVKIFSNFYMGPHLVPHFGKNPFQHVLPLPHFPTLDASQSFFSAVAALRERVLAITWPQPWDLAPIVMIKYNHYIVILVKFEAPSGHQTWRAGKWTIEINDIPS